MSTGEMLCPGCGVAMNHHADKVDYTAALEESATADPIFGGLLEEIFTCPGCGRTEMRPAGGASSA